MTRSQTTQARPAVVFQPAAYRGMQQGIDQIVEAIRPTLGPRPRLVAIERASRSKPPELLDSGGVIARRIIELPDPDQNMGAMFIRGLLWRLHEQVGDGTATAATLFQSLFNQGVRYMVSGGNAMLLRRHLEGGMQLILDTLTSMTTQVEGKEDLERVAASICYDPPLARLLGEILDIVGEYGWLEIRSSQGRELEREYVEGAYWEGGVLSRQMLDGQPKPKVEMENAAILISDLEVEDPQQLVPVMDVTLQAGLRSLLIVAGKLSDSAIGLLQANRDPAKFQAIAVQAPAPRTDERAAALEDLAVLTGGIPLLKAAGDTLGRVTLAELGRARRVWADRSHFGVVAAQGDPHRLRAQIASLREAISRVGSGPSSFARTPQAGDAEARRRLQQRMGKLMGGSAILWVGGATESEIALRKELAQRTADALRGAVLEGVLPGGGVSLLACCPRLRQMLDQSTDPDERFAYRALLRAMEEPCRTIITNAGYDASEIMSEIRRGGLGCGFDVISGQIVDVWQAGILDVAAVQKAAVRSAVSGAGLALTVDTLVRRKRPAVSMEPD